MSKKLPHLIPKGRLQNIKLRYFAVPALLVLMAATVTEAAIAPMPDLSWTSPSFFAFRLFATLSMNVLVFCLFFYLIRKKGTFDEMNDENFKLVMKVFRPCLTVTVIMTVADCVRVALLHPQSTGDTTSAWFFGCFLIAAILFAKQRGKAKTAGATAALVISIVLAVFFLAIYVIGWLADLSVL